MGLRGKKSDNVCAMELVIKKKPKPPKRLPRIAKAMWKQIVDSLPVEHFRRSELPLLEKYCMAEDLYWKAIDLMDKSMVITTAKGYSLPDTYLTIVNKQVQLRLPWQPNSGLPRMPGYRKIRQERKRKLQNQGARILCGGMRNNDRCT